MKHFAVIVSISGLNVLTIISLINTNHLVEHIDEGAVYKCDVSLKINNFGAKYNIDCTDDDNYVIRSWVACLVVNNIIAPSIYTMT